MRRRAAGVLCLLAVAGCSSSSDPKPVAPIPQEKLDGAPRPLAALHKQRNELLDGGTKAFKTQLRKLRGYPVVVNAWGSWCTPCRAEFPHLRSAGIDRAKTVAFLGVDVQDPESGARDLLKEQPVTYPSYIDGDGKIAALFHVSQGLPATAFYAKSGKLSYLHVGPYKSKGRLEQDIDRYAR
jgi:cytochrome c biogenesis protein CcmG, thiol:disulfide interchange protein DsbE